VGGGGGGGGVMPLWHKIYQAYTRMGCQVYTYLWQKKYARYIPGNYLRSVGSRPGCAPIFFANIPTLCLICRYIPVLYLFYAHRYIPEIYLFFSCMPEVLSTPPSMRIYIKKYR